MRYYSEEQIGPKRARTPEGYLICSDVPIARTGVQKYDGEHIPEVTPFADGTVDMDRPESEVFHPAAIASFEGKPVTNDHPDEGMVGLGNHRDLSVGHVQNVRRGTGGQNDLLLADMFITDPQAIEDIESGKVEVSCGYDHDVEVVGRGKGRQRKIIGNHVALVDQARCGPRCAIGDSAMSRAKVGISGLLRRAFRAKDAAELEKIEDEAEGIIASPVDEGMGGDQQVHIHLPTDKARDAEEEEEREPVRDAADRRMDAIEEKLDKVCDAIAKLSRSRDRRRDEFDPEELDEQDPMLQDESMEEEDDAEEETESRDRSRDEFGEAPPNKGGKKILGELQYTNPLTDAQRRARDARRRSGRRDSMDRRRATDSVHLEDDFQAVLADAEIIMPGVRLMTFDASASPAITDKRMCAYRRRVIDAAMKDDDVAGIIETVNGGRAPNLRTASCDSVKALFSATAALRRSSGGVIAPSRVGRARDAGMSQVSKMQKANAEFWAKHGVTV